ncbi:MAG: flavodoxin family protein [Bacteroidota bacterium]
MFNIFLNKLKESAQAQGIENPYHPEECTCVIACGSEMGTTMVFSIALQKFLLEMGIKCHLIEMNDFRAFPTMDHLLILTSTHGVGNAPFNALQFIRKFNRIRSSRKFQYAVVGFGSRRYPTFCHFAENVDFLLRSKDNTTEWIALTRINDQSLTEFKIWFDELFVKMGGQLSIQFDPPNTST